MRPTAAACTVAGALLLGVAGCGGAASVPPAAVSASADGSPQSPAMPSTAPAGPSGGASVSSPGAGTPSAGKPGSGSDGSSTTRHAFPVAGGKGSYAHTHHDYPASDVMVACGTTAVAAADGTVVEVNRVDTWTAKVNSGESRGGLSVSIIGTDNVRYYGSHYSSVDADIVPGAVVKAGQPIAKVGRTGDASACHVHFGISPVCQKQGDWWTRRGVIWPWSYLDAWKAGREKSPAAEITAWQNTHGCPTKALVDP